jgi:hypothetical protein
VLFYAVRGHYDSVAASLSTRGLSDRDLTPMANVAIVPVADVHRGSLRALTYAKRISPDVRAVSIATAPEVRQRLLRRWRRFPELTEGIHLDIIDYDFRDIIEPLVEYIDRVNNQEFPGQLVTVVVPEFIPESLGARLLHNQTANFLRGRLRNQEDLVIIEVPYPIDEELPEET